MQSEFCEAAEVVQFAGMTVQLISGGDASPVSVMDMNIARLCGAPKHKSLDEEKIFTLVEGQLEFTLCDTTRVLNPGDRVTVARGDVHGFTNRLDQNARMFLVSTPARHDRFFRAMAALPVPHSPESVRALCATFRQEIVGL
nr:hypothetical protein HUO10_004761 [Paraburkholderia busanensis]